MASFSSSLSVCQHHILFYTICSHHMAKEHQLLFCCPLSQRHISPLACPIFISSDSFVLFSVQETFVILLHIHISQASIFFSIALFLVDVSQTIEYHRKDYCVYNSCFCLPNHVFFFHIFSRPCIATLPSVILLRISFSHLPSHSTKAPKKKN